MITVVGSHRRTAPATGGGGGGGFAAPDIVSQEDFETGFGRFTNTAQNADPDGTGQHCRRYNTESKYGSWSMGRPILPNPQISSPGDNDQGGDCVINFNGSYDRTFCAFWMKVTANVSSIMKFHRYETAALADAHGFLFLGNGNDCIGWCFDAENSATQDDIGLTTSDVINSGWNHMEIDHWRNGDPSGYPSAAFYWNGVLQARPDGTKQNGWDGVSYCGIWQGGRFNAGMRNTGALKTGVIQMMGTMNTGNTATGAVYIDRYAVSTTRIGVL